jgi:DNA-binding NarL/FixJ family response regulator
MRIVLAEDSVLFREGLTRLLIEGGHQVTSALDNADALERAVQTDHPDLVIVDVRMPPGMTEDGAQMAQRLRTTCPTLPILLLSQHIETRHAVALVTTGGFGYLLKDRVLHVADFLDACTRVASGGSALDPEIVAALVHPRRPDDAIQTLSGRERDVLELVAQGKSNAAISAHLVVAERTVETHMRSIFHKLNLHESDNTHRRVLAVLTYLTNRDSQRL